MSYTSGRMACLERRKNGSGTFYSLYLELGPGEDAERCIVNATYGSIRGNGYRTHIENEDPVAIKEAERIFAAVLLEKLREGYTLTREGRTMRLRVGLTGVDFRSWILALLNKRPGMALRVLTDADEEQRQAMTRRDLTPLLTNGLPSERAQAARIAASLPVASAGSPPATPARRSLRR